METVAHDECGSDEAFAYVLQAYKERKDAVRRRLEDFRKVPHEDWFYEFCYCLCTPQSKAVHAAIVVRALQDRRFKEQGEDPTSLLRQPENYIRFHNTKARNLMQLREQWETIEGMLQHGHPARDEREWLVSNVRGMGMKEASHVLRNIGRRGIAIIDRHILKHLHRCGVIGSAAFPTSIRAYEEIELRWTRFACDIRIDMDELDLVFWSLETGEILK